MQLYVPLLEYTQHFSLFIPVIRDVIIYLNSITTNEFISENSELLVKIVNSEYQNQNYVRYWTAEFLSNHMDLIKNQNLRNFVYNRGHIRAQAIASCKEKNLSWIRSVKDNIFSYGDSDRRNIIYAAQILPPGERSPWLKNLKQAGVDILDEILIKWIKDR